MLLAAALSICSMMPIVVDDIVRLREEKGVTETEFREAIRRRDEMPAELKTRALGAVNLIYALPRGSDYWSVKQQIILTCDNKETIRGYQHSTERARGGAGNRSGHEQHRRVGSDEAQYQDPR